MLIRRHPVTTLRLLWKTFMHKTRHRTLDRDAVPVLTSEKIGPQRAITPEGFLLCLSVPIARAGMMIYGAGEIPLKPNRDGLIRVVRDADVLFDPMSLASYQGKPVVDEHPDEDVGPKNWKELAVGITLNPRPGEGEDSDCVVADLLITDHEIIREIEAGKREVSAGYEADYEQLADGEGRQTNIMGNHIALVEKGRCGPRCSIRDHQPKELQSMGTKTTTVKRRAAVADSIRKAFKDAETSMLSSLEGDGMGGDEPDGDEGANGDTHIHIHANGEGGDLAGGGNGAHTNDDPTEARFAALEQAVSDIQAAVAKLGGAPAAAPAAASNDGAGEGGNLPNDEEEVKAVDGLPDEVAAAMKSKTADSAALETSWRSVMADAEVLVPGFRFPTFDAKAKRRSTMDSMCKTRRSVLSHLVNTTDGETLVKSVNGGSLPDLAAATCVETATLFRSAAGARKLLNNSGATRDAQRLPNGQEVQQPQRRAGPQTIAELNKMHADFHAGKH